MSDEVLVEVEKKIDEHVKECSERWLQAERRKTTTLLGLVALVLTLGVAVAHSQATFGHTGVEQLAEKISRHDHAIGNVVGRQEWLVNQLYEMVEAAREGRKPRLFPPPQ